MRIECIFCFEKGWCWVYTVDIYDALNLTASGTSLGCEFRDLNVLRDFSFFLIEKIKIARDKPRAILYVKASRELTANV